MIVTCPRCHRSLASGDGTDAPSFCMYCGHKLRDEIRPATSALMQTGSFSPGESINSVEDTVAPEPAPTVVGGYRLLRLLGAGGMGTVYEAEAPGSSRHVAVKLLSSRLASSPTSVERFRQEGRLASQVVHPRCVFVLAADTDEGRPYIVMELMPGETLKDVVDRRGPLPPDEAITRILDVIDGLIEAHRVGMIHRDMKPSNCFLTADNRVKVGDFGLSKSLVGSHDHHLTQSGAFLGTVLFASPEQIRGEPLDYSSDVYSVCATLYYLLCGEAPYQHESVTAALAKAISEDAPPIRSRRPEVSRGLDAAVMAGLERDRERRWQSLDDLREALVHLLPARQHPARPRSLIGAYVIDRVALAFLTGPAELLRLWATGTTEGRIDLFDLRWVSVIIMVGYFAICEGLFGATVGKWLLGLRVSRIDQTGAPGIRVAFIRTLVFHTLILGIFLIPEWLVEWLGAVAGGILGGVVFLTAGAAILVQLRKKWHHRGVHDLASRCHVTQRPFPARKLRLPNSHPGPLDKVLPVPDEPLPDHVGAYTIRGRLAADPSGEQVWVGEDRVLARSVLFWLRPQDSDGATPVPEVYRPARLRRLGTGSLTWAGQRLEWSAFAAPLGGPLAEAVRLSGPLPWADARYLLDQLVEELRAAETDGTLPPRLGLDQIWVEPNGRIQLLDCSPSGNLPGAAAPTLILVREVAALALEGRARRSTEPVRAPVPPHATFLLDRLFARGGYARLADLQCDLADTHAHRPEVTPAVRAAQLGIQAALLASVLVVMYALAIAAGPIHALLAASHSERAEAALAALNDPVQRAKFAESEMLAGPLRSPRLVPRLEEFRDRKRAEAEYRRSVLFRPQTLVVEMREQNLDQYGMRELGNPAEIRELIQWAGALENTPRGQSDSPWHREGMDVLIAILAISISLAIAAAILRGGISMILAGIAIVRADGQRATRRQCGLRAAVVWCPIALLLFTSALLQTYAPDRPYVAAFLWLLAVLLVPVYLVIAIRFPTRPPQDRVTNTYLVPS